MKKLIAILLALVIVCGLAACGNNSTGNDTTANTTETTTETTTDTTVEGVMTYSDYVAAEMESEVTVLCYVQANQSWWEDKITVYAADKDGAYFLYNMACSEEDSKKLTPGTAIKVTGTKGEWSGEVEIMDATFTFVEGAESYVAEAVDLTDKLGTDEVINYQNQLAAFTGMTFKSLAYQDETPGKDIYVTLTKDGKDYSFCVESYLTGKDTDVYKAVEALVEGDVVDVEGFVYWYEGMNPHITKVTVK